MYAEHQPIIANYALESPQHYFRVGLFVLSTINRHFEHVTWAMANYDQDGEAARCYTTQQHRAIKAFAKESPRLWERWSWQKETSTYTTTELMLQLISQPGFGIVKAGFFLQLTLSRINVGCLDRHHLRAMGLHEKTFMRVPTNTESLTKHLATYITVCAHAGGSETLWNQWCHILATLRPKSFANADHVSAYHVYAITGEANHVRAYSAV